MASILSPRDRDIHYTLDLTVGATEFHFATAPLTAVNGHDYTNDLEKVGEIRQTWEAPADQVSVAVQNKDRVLGQHVAANLDDWKSAQAVIGRYYYQMNQFAQKTGTNEWIEMFRGAVQQPNIDDLRVTFSIVADTISPGPIVCSRNEAPTCPWAYKGPDCGYSGGLPSCDHTLTGVNGCDVHSNNHRFGGCEHRYAPDASIPGTGGNDDPGSGGVIGGGGCPRLDQLISIKGPGGGVVDIPVYRLTEEDQIWDPIEEAFFPTRVVRMIKDVPIWALATANGAMTYSSFSHRVMPDDEHPTGLPVELIAVQTEVLTEVNNDLFHSYSIISQPLGERGDVMFIEMVDGHRYCTGEMPGLMIVAHNRKDDRDPLDGGDLIIQ